MFRLWRWRFQVSLEEPWTKARSDLYDRCDRWQEFGPSDVNSYSTDSGDFDITLSPIKPRSATSRILPIRTFAVLGVVSRFGNLRTFNVSETARFMALVDPLRLSTHREFDGSFRGTAANCLTAEFA
jgi:hypothetical protein